MKTTKSTKESTLLLIANGSDAEPTHAEIALRAYALWEQEGHPQNQEVATWLQAETQLRQTRNQHGLRA